MSHPPRINQIAICVSDLAASRAFYRDLFEVPCVGGTRFTGKVTERVQGMAGATSDVAWLMDDREFFQFEMFQFEHPVPKPFAKGRRPWDIGYSRLAIEVADVAAFHARCKQRAVAGLTPIRVVAGKPYFTLRDPDQVLIEVGAAARALPAGRGARFAGAALSVPQFDLAMISFHRVIGCPVLDASPPDKGVLWDEPAASKRSVLLDGGTAWLEINEYSEPRPAPWPEGYRICDFGQQNVAFGSRDGDEIRALYRRMVDGGFKPNTQLVSSANQVVLTYLNDPQRFCVEILMVRPWLDGVMGFRQSTVFDRVLTKVMMALA
ncbi:MAG: VOC family protein [Burkholderiales bacterium]|nr:VOC family protein [Burkholderiales bacterium]